MVAAGKEAFSRESVRVATWPYYLFAVARARCCRSSSGSTRSSRGGVGSPVRATFVSFVVGDGSSLLVAVLVFAAACRRREARRAPWWVWVGGFLGAFYVLGSVVTAPKLGAATLFAFILAGQAAASLAVDHFGWVGFEENPVTPGRLLGIALVAAGVAAVRFL